MKIYHFIHEVPGLEALGKLTPLLPLLVALIKSNTFEAEFLSINIEVEAVKEEWVRILK